MNNFSKARRLINKNDYERVFKQPKKLITADFIVLYCHNAQGFPRLGLAIAKKKIPKACNRNRLKRLLRETFRVSVLPPIDIIFLARLNIANQENKEIIAKLNKIWAKLKNYPTK